MAESTDEIPSIGRRIEKFYTDRGLSRAEFARAIGLSYDKITSYVSEKAEPGLVFWQSVVDVFPDADLGWLLLGSSSFKFVRDSVKIPIVHRVHAGGPILGFADQEIIGWTETTNTKDKDLFALIVHGRSMYPEVHEGDLAICAPHRPFMNGQLYVAVLKGDEATLKRVFQRASGYELTPINPDYEVVRVDPDQVERLYRVIEVQRKFL